MAERGSGFRLAQQVVAAHGFRGAAGEDFYGYVAVQDFIVRAIDYAHAALADLGQDPVVVEKFADHGSLLVGNDIVSLDAADDDERGGKRRESKLENRSDGLLP